MRVTKSDVDQAYETYISLLESVDVDVSKYELHHGSKHYGNSFKVYNDGLGGVGTDSMGYLGMTRREAYDTLWTIIRTIRDLSA